MTTIGPQAYASNSALVYGRSAPPPPAAAQKAVEDTAAAPGGGGSVNVTLSDAAKAAMKAQGDLPTIDNVASAARKAIDALLTDAKATTALSNGQRTIDMSELDRRSLFAVASNQGGGFTTDEQAVAAYTMANNFENALAGPVAASRITGDYAPIYKAGLAYLDKAGSEEKATAAWAAQHDALTKGQQQTASRPNVLPAGIPNDPVAQYMASLGDAAPTTATRDILKVAGDVRAALDAQYAKASNTDADKLDLAAFDDRALAAIALDKGDQFSVGEISAAKNEIRGRTSTNFSGSASSDSSTGSLSGDLITRYASMSEEERQAQGWTPDLYEKMVQTYQLSQKLAAMSGGGSDNPYLTGANRPMSLLDQLT